MAKVVLDQAQVIASVGQGKATGMAKHVRMDAIKTRPLSRDRDDPMHGLARQRLMAFGDEQPRKLVPAQSEPSTKGAQCIAGDRLLDGQAVLEPRNPEPGLGKVDIVAA